MKPTSEYPETGFHDRSPSGSNGPVSINRGRSDLIRRGANGRRMGAPLPFDVTDFRQIPAETG